MSSAKAPVLNAPSEFPKWEIDFFNYAKAKYVLKCMKCESTMMMNAGQAGNHISGQTFSCIQIQCRNRTTITKEDGTTGKCGVKRRLADVLQFNNLPGLVKLYEEAYAKVSKAEEKFAARLASSKAKKEAKNTTTAKNTVRKPPKIIESSSEDEYTNSDSDDEDLTEVGNEHIKKLEDENNNLKKQLNEIMEKLKISEAKVENLEIQLKEKNEELKPIENPAKPKEGQVTKESNPKTKKDKEDSDSKWTTVVKRKLEKTIKPKKSTPKKNQESLTRMITPVGEPKEFNRVHIRLTDSRALKYCKSMKEVTEILRNLLESIKIKHLVVDFSLIGRSVLELYTTKEKNQELVETLKKSKASIIENFDLSLAPTFGKGIDTEEKLVKRLAYIYVRNKLKNMRKAILQGIKEETQERIKEMALEISETRLQAKTAKKDNTSSQ
jgi:hypothetical protein